MSKYTTGELAKLCGVSVRTVQYYDNRELLIPSEVSEGGRRLYSNDDFSRMKIICFLRGLDLSIDSIKQLLDEENCDTVISMLLEEREMALRAEIAEKQRQADTLSDVKRTLLSMRKISPKAIGGIAYIMENKKKLKRLHILLLILGFVSDAIQACTLMIWIFTGKWLPFALGMAAAIAFGIFMSFLYFTRTVYVCPECHSVFKPRFAESFFAGHTPHTRKLTCTRCNYHGFCIETYDRRTENAENR